ncbi:MAG TPA: DUF1800 domain-containing protein [Miltoncostaeales bacterium]|jgi:uncharacterized protein (DUF1800 family)|nr:DUF1800 domain-containing protein [Miltoncostaeales bacterium]
MATTTRPRIERLYWRAGFGALPAELNTYSRLGVSAAVQNMLRPSGAQLRPTRAATVGGRPIDPFNEWGHDVLWWLDRAVRGRHQLVERMTLNWHDHFAVSNDKVGNNRWMVGHYWALRRYALGSFRALMHTMLRDRAMQMFLDLANSNKADPNENFARELLELYTLGVNNGYTERDIREAARALTGFTFDWGTKRFGWDPAAHDTGVKRIFGRRGNFGPADVVNLAIAHPRHARYLCLKLWGYFTPLPCPAATLKRMIATYRISKTRVGPVIQIILGSPEIYANLGEPDMVKPPFVYTAGMLRKTNQGVHVLAWRWLLDGMGQVPFYPPNVSGWDQNEAWMTTGAIQARFDGAGQVIDGMRIKDGSIAKTQTPAMAYRSAVAATGRPWMSPISQAAAARYAKSVPARHPNPWEVSHYWPERQRVLRHVMLAGPDAQVC